MESYHSIIFVGESGTGRSAMAEAILKEYKLKYPIEISSRALVSLFPEPINQKAEAVLISNGITLPNHMSQQLTNVELKQDALIIVMEQLQKDKIIKQFPSARPDQIKVLTDLTGDELEIMNPYGQSLQAYGLCYEMLNNTIRKLVTILNEGE